MKTRYYVEIRFELSFNDFLTIVLSQNKLAFRPFSCVICGAAVILRCLREKWI